MINEFLLGDFGKRIKSLRMECNWTQEDLAAETGFHRTYIGMIERGERNISLTHIAVFASVFKMTVSELTDFKTVDSKHSYKKYQNKSEK